MKRCPFCGGNMEGQPGGFSASSKEVVANFICVHCDVAIIIFRKTYVEALEAWGTRPIEDELLQALQALYDAQNGAPLERDRQEWEEAMRKAEEALMKARGK